ncbi:MAG: DUF3540 domain-containing protein [Planctomycetes bacterium]|nr:DUF3540 domain-containing protein [Planctomycetota bacterium]
MLETVDPLRLIGASRAPAAAPRHVPAGVRVGLADVVSVEGDVVVRLWEDGALATPGWALPYPYAPAPGDQVVVIGRGDRRWVIAVARGRGATLLWVDGDAALAAGGRLRLAGDVAVRVVGETLTLRARAVDVAAATLHVVADDATEVVRGAARLVAGAVQRVTRGAETVIARRVTILGRALAKVDGKVTIIG